MVSDGKSNHFSSVCNMPCFLVLLIFCLVFTSLISWCVWAWSLKIYSWIPWMCKFMTFNKFVKWSAIYFFKYVFIHCYRSFTGRSMTWIVWQVPKSVHFFKSELPSTWAFTSAGEKLRMWEELSPGDQGPLRSRNDSEVLKDNMMQT